MHASEVAGQSLRNSGRVDGIDLGVEPICFYSVKIMRHL